MTDEIICRKGPYSLTADGAFIIDDYHRAKPFSSFLPGVAGLWGVPMWLYFVNRGQAVACFGTEDKDHAILPFESANLHHRRIADEGFRTFIRLADGRFYEPFRSVQDDSDVTNRLEIRPNSLGLVETNATLGLEIRVEMACATGESFPALARRVTIRNTGAEAMDCELIDGLGRILPYYIPAELEHVMPFISEGYLQVEGLEQNLPLLKNKAQSSDTPETEFVRKCHFFFGLDDTAGDGELLPAIVDFRRVFGDTLDWHRPYAFLQAQPFDPSVRQDQHAMTPSAMVYWQGSVRPDADQSIRLTIGQARNAAEARGIPTAVSNRDWFDANNAAAEREISRIADHMFLHSSRRVLDLYAGRSFVDNTLRGGLPLTLGSGAGKKIFHVFSRRHGDLERDYNNFQLDATYLSQGNGAFRDVNQNRRSDVWFNPDIEDQNVRFFFNLIQPDGFNPLQIQGARFAICDEKALGQMLDQAFAPEQKQTVANLLEGDFAPGELFEGLIEAGIEPKMDRRELLDALVNLSEKIEAAEFEAGYWADHWFYNFDLLESYLAIFPDRLRPLLVDNRDYTYWDPDVQVKPRREKYVIYRERELKHLDSIRLDPEKAALVESRKTLPRLVRLEDGQGPIHRTNLLEKLLCLLANKAATFSPSGLGIEMDGGRPGWNDSVNGLPGLFGASVSEVIQLKRAVEMTHRLAEKAGLDESYSQPIPAELAGLIGQLQKILTSRIEAADSPQAEYDYWDRANDAKEEYRLKVHLGFSGKMAEITWARISKFLQAVARRTQISLDKSVDPATGLLSTYITHKPVEYEPLFDPDGQPLTSERGAHLAHVSAFQLHRFPAFLEAPLHALRIEQDPHEARRLDQAVRNSPLRDEKLQMYIAGDSVAEENKDLGRIYAWPAGWFENENVFTHAEYKYLLSQLRAGLAEEFFEDMQTCMVCFQDIERFGRSPIENISFIVSSRHPRPDYHGRGFLPRTSGTTSEVLNIALWMSFGPQPFEMVDGRLRFSPQPRLADWLFTRQPESRMITCLDGSQQQVDFAADTFAARLFGSVLVVYHNPSRRSTFGPEAVAPKAIKLTGTDGRVETIEQGFVEAPAAEAIRERKVERIDIQLG